MSTAGTSDAFVVGGWELIEGLHGDAVSEAWVAREIAGRRRVGRLNRLKPAAAEQSGASDAFLGRARALARLRQPLLARLLEVGSDGGTPFAVCENVDGASAAELGAAAARGGATLPPGVALRIVLDAATAVAALHGARLPVAHGAVNAERVVVTAGGLSVLLPSAARPADGDARPAGDVRALGVLLWELIAGRPLEGNATPPRLEAAPAAVADLIARTLETSGTRISADAGAFATALEEAGGDVIADRAEVADAFRRLVGNDVAARRLELEAMIAGADGSAAVAAAEPEAPAPAELAAATPAEPPAETAPAAAPAQGADAGTAGGPPKDESRDDDEDVAEGDAIAEQGSRTQTLAERRAAKRARKRAARRALNETPTVAVVNQPAQRTPAGRPVALDGAAAAGEAARRPVRAVAAVLGAAVALLIVGLALRGGGDATGSTDAPAPLEPPARVDVPARRAAEPAPAAAPTAAAPAPEPAAAPVAATAPEPTPAAAAPPIAPAAAEPGARPAKLGKPRRGAAAAVRPAAPTAPAVPAAPAVRSFDELPPASGAKPPAAPPAPAATIPPVI